MFRPRVHPGGFQAVFLLEGCVGDGELVLCAELEQEAPVVVTVTNAVSSKDSFPGLRIPPNSSVEVAKDEDLRLQGCCSRVCADRNRRCLCPQGLPEEWERRH